MVRRRIYFYLRVLCLLLALSTSAFASEYHGKVSFGGVPVPGATVTVVQGNKRTVTVTDQQGLYSFPDLADGSWTIEVEMTGFAPVKQDVTVAPNGATGNVELKLMSLADIRTATKPIVSVGAPVAQAPQSVATKGEPAKAQAGKAPDAPPPPPPDETAQRAADGLLVNGSVNNAATSQFALSSAFGNSRNSGKGLYTGAFGVTIDNSALDARQLSFTGLNSAKPSYNQVTLLASLGGPIRIPHLLRNGPNFFVSYRWTRNNNDSILPGQMPTQLERMGDFSQTLNAAGQPIQLVNPLTGLPFPGNVVPISPQAQALLRFYPLPNSNGNTAYNYQIPVLTDQHQDQLQSRLNQRLGNKNNLNGTFAFLSSRTGTPNIFGFLDTTDVFGLNTTASWQYRFNQRLYMTTGFQFSRISTRVTPYFENRENVSGDAGISGNNQDPTNWGPPTLSFSSGISGLSDGQSAFNRNRTDGVSWSLLWNHIRHNVTVGGDFRRQEFNYLAQQNPRGAFGFTGVATQATANGVATSGSDFADFLIGVPDTSQIAFGNADKYFRQSVYDAFITDDWRVNSELTLNVGMRWEYGAPITELFGRLVNLDVASGFSAVRAVVAQDPVGSLTGNHYPTSLIRPDKNGFEPRLSLAWRPISGSSLVVRAGYGIYDDTSVYQTIANQMAQQAPLSTSLNVQNSATCPLTLAKGFNPCSSTTQNTFAVDPNFRVGYLQTWQLSVQRDLPWSLQMTATYLGFKGTHGQQEFLPNTYPVGEANPCPQCPLGFAYLTSHGNSTRDSGSIQLRKRLRSGFTATLQYTYSKSLDNDASFGGQGATAVSSPANPFASVGGASAGTTIAQNWQDLNAEYGLSSFDQRHLLNLTAQYTTGMGIGGGTLMSGWRGVLLKEWTIAAQITAGSGLPLTPIYFAAVPETAFYTIRPNRTGASIHATQPGYFLNSAAFAAPAAGQWGNARKNSITGPEQFLLNAQAARTFRLDGRFNLDLQVYATNFLNHVTYTAWNTTLSTNNTQFGLPTQANGMRTLQTTLRLRF